MQIVDDDGWEPDEDFYVELYDKNTGERLHGQDAVTRVTILDDDKPGMLVFEEKKAIRHPANEDTCHVVNNFVKGIQFNILQSLAPVINQIFIETMKMSSLHLSNSC